MQLELPGNLLAQHARSKQIIREIHHLELKPYLTEEDMRSIAELRAELSTLLTPKRFCWIDGRPVIDILDELIKINQK